MLPETSQLRQANDRLLDLLSPEWSRLYRLLDPRRLDETFKKWVAAAGALTSDYYGAAAELARGYMEDLALPVVASAPFELARFAISMHVTGVAAVKRASADGLGLAGAAALGLRLSEGAAARHALDGGRNLIAASSDGWVRVGEGDCDFCQQLIDSKDVLTSNTFPAHDHCRCMAEPVREG